MLEFILYVILFMLLVTTLALFYQWFDRKVHARYQHRVGPLITGPHGILQPLADLIKLLTKEEIIPEGSDEKIIYLSAILSVSLVLFVFLFIPMFSYEGILSFEGDLLIVIAISVIVSLLMVIAAYSTKGPFSNIGAARTLELIISYEVPFILSIASIVILVRSITISEIVENTINTLPPIIFAPIAFIAYVFSTVAKVEKVPFDIPEAETELGAGWLTEFSGRTLAMFRLSLDLKLFFMAALGAILFFGGVGLGFSINPLIDPLITFLIFFIKVTVIVFIITTIRSIVARYRIDQAMNIFWRWIIPLSILQIILIIMLRCFEII